MACEDCGYARASTAHRRFDPKCPWCGARYLQMLKTWPAPRDMGGRPETTKERQAWRAQVLKDWTDFGHDEQQLRDLAAAEKVPLEPLEDRHADHHATPAHGQRTQRARTLHNRLWVMAARNGNAVKRGAWPSTEYAVMANCKPPAGLTLEQILEAVGMKS